MEIEFQENAFASIVQNSQKNKFYKILLVYFVWTL